MENSASSILGGLLPIIILTSMVALAAFYLIRKKGKSLALLILAFIPFFNSFLILYLLAQTNRETLEDIKTIKDHLGID